jgi:hypothetical protein
MNSMNRIEIPRQADQQKWKKLFEGSLNRLNGRTVPTSQQPICRVRRETTMQESDAKAAITTAAQSLAALWQISAPRGQGI